MPLIFKFSYAMKSLDLMTRHASFSTINLYLEDSPSLRRYLCQEWLEKAYRIAHSVILEIL